MRKVRPIQWRFEAAARKALADHRSATACILLGVNADNADLASKCSIGSGFIVQLKPGECKVMTCYHCIKEYIKPPMKAHVSLWVRLYGAEADSEVTGFKVDEARDLAVLSLKLPQDHSSATALEFSNETKIGTICVLLGYFNHKKLRDLLAIEDMTISLTPSSIPGEITGPLMRMGVRNHRLIHSCYGMKGCSGSPLIHKGSTIGVFCASRKQIHMAIPSSTIKEAVKLWIGNKVGGDDSLNAMLKRL